MNWRRVIRKLLLIANPVSGNKQGAKLADRVQADLLKQNVSVETVFTERKGHAQDLAANLDLGLYQGLAVIGGDGSVFEVINGLMPRNDRNQITLGVIPGGTGNSIHRHLGIKGVAEGIASIAKGQYCTIDLMRFRSDEQQFFCSNMIGWAGVANIAKRAEKFRWLGGFRYTLSALVEIMFTKRQSCTISLDDQQITDQFFLIIGCNTQQVGSGMLMAPKASIDDGLVDVVIVRNARRFQLLNVLNRVHSGRHVDLPYVEYHQVQKFSIASEHSAFVNVDGEVLSHPLSNLEVDVVPKCLQVFA